MDDDFLNCGFDLNGDGKLDLIEKSLEMDDFERTLNQLGSSGTQYTSRATIKRKSGRFSYLIFIIAFIVLMVLLDKMPDIITGIENRVAYSKAEELIDDEDYSNALDELNKILGEYKDSDGLEDLCWAHKYEAEGEYGMAYACLYDATFHYQNAEQMRKINTFKSRMEQGFYEEVDREIEEERKAEAAPAKPEANKKSSNTGSYYSGKTFSNDDPYDASDYSHPDDFYYDHYDDFYDYEEAEEYYDEYN